MCNGLGACSLELNWLGFSYKKHHNFADILVEYTLWKVKIYKLLVYISLKKLEKKIKFTPWNIRFLHHFETSIFFVYQI